MLSIGAGILGFGDASRYGSSFDKTVRLLLTPALQHPLNLFSQQRFYSDHGTVDRQEKWPTTGHEGLKAHP
jgi:hypothetical protein